MSYLGRATNIKFETKLNGTHTLTFEMPDRFFDSEKGDYVKNEFIDTLFSERKIKLKFRKKWYEFYIKGVADTKHFKSFIKRYTCSDAFIDELSRNGYGITFDTELYNNVEEMGTFSTIILEDSIWDYAPEHNWGDFTEYLEEKLFKIPVDMFNKLVGHKLYYKVDRPLKNEKIINIFTNEKRDLELGDDLAAAQNGKGGYFWDAYDGSMPLMENKITDIPNDGYIYVPYSQLEFCYRTTSEGGKVYAATEEVCYYDNKSYAIAPPSVDPTALIQFIAIPKGAEIKVDEAGLIVNKDYTYVMTVQEWNDNINSKCYYRSQPTGTDNSKAFYDNHEGKLTYEEAAVGNLAAYYEGYLDKIGDLDVVYGKKISVTDRTEVNITDEIDQYVKVYNQKWNDEDLMELYVNPDGNWNDDLDNEIEYRVCSKTETRQIVPQLARNFLQNGTKIKSVDGWEFQAIYDGDQSFQYTTPYTRVGTWEDETAKTEDFIQKPQDTFLQVFPAQTPLTWKLNELSSIYECKGEMVTPQDNPDIYKTLINFGIVGQEKEITLDKIYCLGIKIGIELPQTPDGYTFENATGLLYGFKLKIGEGSVQSEGEYSIKDSVVLDLSEVVKSTDTIISINTKSLDGREELTKKIKIYEGYVYIKFNNNIKNPYFAISNSQPLDFNSGHDGKHYRFNYYQNYYIFNSYLFEAYTKGIDQFDEENLIYRYSGRDLFDTVLTKNMSICRLSDKLDSSTIHSQIIFEEDVMPGDVYDYQHYFIQQVAAYESNYETGVRDGKVAIQDTFAQKELLNNYADIIHFKNTNLSNHDLPYSAAQFTNDDLQIATRYIDLNKCIYYNQKATLSEPDCSYDGEHICLYQKYGYCPYLFETEKHCRKIRTLTGEKSNRFNLTQELGKVFEMYPIYWTEHHDNGKIITDIVEGKDDDGNPITYERMRKKMFYIKEKGMENKLGFRYEKNLSNISRDIKSDQIVSKLYVADVDSDLSKTGLCSIKTAEDNPSKDSFIINFDYYTTKGLLDKDLVDADLYGIGTQDFGYLKQMGHLNGELDKIANKRINLETGSLTELEANIEYNLTGIETAQKQLAKIKKQLDRYKSVSDDEEAAKQANEENQSYQNQIEKYNEQLNILNNLIFETFFDQVTYQYINLDTGETVDGSRDDVMNFLGNWTINEIKDSPYVKQHTYLIGMLGQYNREYLQVSEWKKQEAALLKQVNKISLRFFRKYEPYLKEGTWSDNNYISDNAYYFGACEVAAEGAIPKVSYNISVIDLNVLPEYEEYEFNIADTTYVEDIGMFGINKKTGSPNRLKVLISGITYDLDEPSKNSIKIQNFTTQFEDLFQQVAATVQTLTFNENIYKRASNFTSTQNISQDSLQGTLDTNSLQLIKTEESNVEIDKQGQSGSDMNNHSNKYELNGQGMFFSTDGGQSWDVGVGPGGINADYIKVGTLDAGKIRIVDNNYLYFLWDKNGISAFREPQSTDQVLYNDYALFNRYGLSLVEEGKIRLRAGYSFNGASAAKGDIVAPSEYGKIATETSQGDHIGFYLYNTEGDEIFKTEAPSKDTSSDAMDTARLSLRGEIFVTDAKLTDSEAEVISQHKIYQVVGGYNLTNKVVYTYIEDTSSDWQSRIALEIGDVVEIDGQNYELISKTEQPVEYCYIDDKLGVSYLTDMTLIFNLQGGTSSDPDIEEHYYLTSNQDKCYYLTSTTESISVIHNYDSGISDYTLNDKMTAEELKVYFQNSGQLNEKQTLNLILTSDGYDKDQKKTTNLPYSYWSNKTYTGEKTDPSGKGDDTSAIGLFINNKISLDSTNEELAEYAVYYDENVNKRIFCCSGLGEDNSNKNNIFTILKNGNLFIGGQILYPDGSSTANMKMSKMPDVVRIDNPKIKMTNDGTVYMDFNNFKDMNNNSIIETITNAVESIKLIRHNHSFDLYVELEVYHFIDNCTISYSGIGSGTISGQEKQTAINYLEEHYVFSIDDVKDRFATDSTLTSLAHNDQTDYHINIEKNTLERVVVRIPVNGEIMYSGNGSAPSSAGPYLADPVQD